MESSFSCFHHSCSIFFPDKTRYISGADAQFPIAHCSGKQAFWQWPFTCGNGPTHGFLHIFRRIPRSPLSLLSFSSPPDHTGVILSTNPSSGRVSTGPSETQCTVWVLMANDSTCPRAWNILCLKADFSGNPPETWTTGGYLGCSPVFHQVWYVATKQMEVLELLFQSWHCALLLDFACAKQ